MAEPEAMGPILSRVDGPQDLHGMSESELEQLCGELRDFITRTIARCGGHLGASLGAVELIVAAHSIIDSPDDKLLFDVGHQAYPHKVLTGRGDRFHTVRQLGGISGFLSRAESEHDVMGAGHASTALGYAVGVAEAAKRLERQRRVVAIVGDGALTGGAAYEAMNYAGEHQLPLVMLFNDNGWSIAPNVGALNAAFTRLRMDSYGWRSEMEEAIKRLPAVGGALGRAGHNFKEATKAWLGPGLFFEELGWAYIGVVDGHDLRHVRRALREALDQRRPVVIHCKTTKGKGYAWAEESEDAGHARTPFDIRDGKVLPRPSSNPQYTKVFGDALVEEARRDPAVVAITAAMPSGTGTAALQKALPDRFFDVGICEQHAVLMAAGMAVEGLKPVVAVYSTFLQRAYDMLVHDLGIQRLPVRLVLDRGGLVGDDGPTHHGVFDMAYLRAIPNFVVMAPKDEAELVHMLHTQVAYEEGPIAMRYPRGAGRGVRLPTEPRVLEIGRGEVLQGGDRVAMIGIGRGVELAEQAAEQLLEGHGIRPTVVNARFVKPLDGDLVEELAREHELVVTVEDHVLTGGFGSAVVERLTDARIATPVLRIGIPDRFIEHGAPARLQVIAGIDPATIVERVAAGLMLGTHV
jgi:1-deoxy-D-xylulose-5-phosphate synthase